MNDATTEPKKNELGKKRLRSPGYPAADLGEALDLAKKIWVKDRSHATSAQAVASHWEYNPKSSSVLTKMAALKQFGLLQELDAGGIKLTDAAVKILANDDPQAPQRVELVKKAALSPKIYAELWQKYGGHLPSDVAMKAYLIGERMFNPDAVDSLLRDFRKTISFAGLSESDMVSVIDDKDDSDVRGDRHPPAVPVAPVTPPAPAFAPQKGGGMTGFLDSKPLELVFNLGGRDVRIPYPMTQDDFEIFEGMIKLWKNRILGTEFPRAALWKNKDTDKPVLIVKKMGERDGVVYYQSKDGTGIPETELEFAD